MSSSAKIFASLLVVGLALVTAQAGAPNYLRANLQYSSETIYPKFAGVPQLTPVSSGQVPKYYSKLDFSGGNESARGALASAGAGGNSRQARTALSGAITYSYDPATDQVTWANNTLLQSGEVLGVPPWDPGTADWPQAPVLTVNVSVSGGGPIAYGQWYIPASNPLGLAVQSATRAADDNVFRGGVFGGNSLDPVEWQDYRVMELTNEDTREMAEARAKIHREPNIGDPNLAHTIGGTPAQGSVWTVRKIHLKYRFWGCEICSGGSLYERRIVYERRALGQSAWQPYRTEHATIQVKDEFNEQEFDLPLEDGFEIRVADLTFEALGAGCADCSAGGLPGGSQGASRGSIRWQIPLGLTATGESAGAFTLYSPGITPALFTPAALRAAVAGENAILLRDAQGAVRQALAPAALADVVTTGASSYEIRFYDRAAVGALGGDGLYAVSGSPYLVWRVDGSPSAPLWRVTRITGAQSVVMTEVDESQPGLTIFTEAGGLRRTETTVSTEAGDRVEDVVVKDAAGAVAARTKTWYRPFAWGEERVKEVLDPAGAALTTQWTYVTNASSGAYRKVDSITRPDGSVENIAYLGDASGQIYQRTGPLWKASVKGTGYRTSLADLDGDGTADYLTSVFEDMFLSNLSLNHTIQWGATVTLGGVKYRLRDHRCATVPGAPWDHAGNIITRERYYAEGAHAGELAYRLNPDGTLLLRRFADTPGGGTALTEETGVADAAVEAVIDGTRTVTTLTARGQPASTLVTDIATNRTLRSEVVGAADAYGRPTQIQHLDGSVETRSYCQSCGTVEQISLRGETVAYEFDALGRKLFETRSAGGTVLSRQRFEHDAAGRLVKTFRVNPADNSETLVAATTHDLAGRVTSSFSPATGTTTRAYAFGPQNTTLTTTTYADGGTRIETRGAGGDLIRLDGTTVAPLEHDWQTREWWGGGTGYIMSTRRYYTATDYVLEYAGFNFLGQVADTSLGDGARQFFFFDALGRPAREVDPDGITTLQGYDAHGRSAVAATDLNGNNAIDYDGTDRLTRTREEAGVREGHTVLRTLTEVWETDGQGAPTVVAINETSADGLRAWSTARGLTTATVTTHDGAGGRTVTTTAPDGTVTTQTYLGDRLLSAVAAHPALGQLQSVTYGYNALGLLTTSTDARTGTTTYTYDAADRLHTVTTPDPDPARSGPGYDPQTTTYEHDMLGRVIKVTQPDGTEVHTTWWPHGQVKRTWGSRTYPAEYTYDVLLRVKTLTTWQDYAGDAGKAVTTWNYNPGRGWLDNKRYADNSGPSYLYKPSGRLLRRTWARGVQTNYAYNAAGDLSTVDYSDATPDVTMQYDRAGRPKTISDGSGTRTLSYHSSGQVQDEIYTAGLMNGLSVARGFDALSRLGSISARSATSAFNQMSFGYDAASRLDSVTSGANTATYAYVPNSPLVESVVFKNGANTRLTATKVYDNLNRLAGITNTPSASSALSAFYQYNTANQRTRATREDNAYWDYGYDPLGQVTSAVKKLTSGTPVNGLDHAWTFDDIGNRKTAMVNSQLTTYTSTLLNSYSQRTVPGTIDVLGEAKADSTVTLTVGNGQPQPVTRQGGLFFKQLTVDNSSLAAGTSLKVTGVKNLVGPNGEDAVTELDRFAFTPRSPETFTHDADGNLTGDARWSYTWDGENRLIAMETTAAAVTAGVARRKLEFAYDSQSRRIAKKVYGWTAGSWVLDSSLLFLYDGWNLLAELDAMNATTLIRSHVWGLDLSGSLQGAGGVGGLLFTTYSLNLTPYSAAAAYDGNDNVIGYVDLATGAKSATYEYGAFGATLIADGEASDAMPFRFSTHYHDQEMGLLYAKNRFIKDGRFLNRDPIEEDGGANPYGFVGNDSINRIDPLGLWSPEAHDYFLDYAFRTRKDVSREKIEIMQASSRAFDIATATGSQYANMHSMRKAGQSQAAARAARDAFIWDKIQEAIKLRKACRIYEAHQRLGEAFHTIMDSTSPEHVDEDGNLRVWINTALNGPGHSPGPEAIPWVLKLVTLGLYEGDETPKDATPEIYYRNSARMNYYYDLYLKD